jgi:hypothetical protein
MCVCAGMRAQASIIIPMGACTTDCHAGIYRYVVYSGLSTCVIISEVPPGTPMFISLVNNGI